MTKKVIFSLFYLLICLAAFGQKVVSGGFEYENINGTGYLNRVLDPTALKGRVEVPMTFEINGVEYDVTHVSENCFANCEKITEIVFETNSLEMVNFAKDYIFKNCSSLTTIDFPRNSFHIGKNIFDGCDYLTTVIIRKDGIPNITPLNVTPQVSNATLYVPANMVSQYIEAASKENDVSGALWHYFKEIKSIDELEVIEESFKEPYEGMFEYTVNNDGSVYLNSIDKLVGGKVIVPAVFYKDEQECYVTRISTGCFEDCKYIEEIEIQSDVETYRIYGNAFKNCVSLKRIELPSDLYGIQLSSLYGCDKLKTIVFNGVKKAVLNNDLENNQTINLKNCALYVPFDLVEDFKSDEEWPIFGRILPIGEPENVKFVFRDGPNEYFAEFLDMAVTHRIKYSGCRVISDCMDEKLFSDADRVISILSPGGFIIEAEPVESAPKGIFKENEAAGSPSILLGAALLELPDFEKGHRVIIGVPEGQSVAASEGTKIENNGDGTYTLTADDNFSAYADDSAQSGVEAEVSSTFKAVVEGSMVWITGLDEDEPVCATDMQGRTLRLGTRRNFSLPAGLYILSSSKGIIKIRL